MTSRRAVRRASLAALETLDARRLFAAPAVDAIAAQTVPVGKTIQIPITSTSDGGAVTYTIRSSSKNVTGSFHPSTNTFIQMQVAGFSQPMVFELFNDKAPETIRRIVGLINSGFYNGLTFHRIVNDFVIQGGDPNGDGTGGPQFQFSDEFNTDTYFTGTGQLAMANSGKDTNGSQFFITEGPQRLLDFNHTIFGQLIRGESTRAAISDLPVDSTTDAPNSPVVITRVSVISDVTDGVLVIKPSVAGTYSIKVTGTNADGSTSKSFTVTSKDDTIDDPPILNTSTLQPVYYTTPGKAVSINLSSIDPEGSSANLFVAQFVSNANSATGSFSGTNNDVVTITPGTTAGIITLKVGVIASSTSQNRGSTSLTSGDTSGISIADSQLITIAVGDLPITAAANNLTLNNGVANKNLVVGTFRDSDASGTASQFAAKVDWGDGTVTAGTIVKTSTGRYEVLADKTYAGKAAGNLPITLTVTGNLGALATAESTATVQAISNLSKAGVLTINGTGNDDKIAMARKGANYLVTVNGATVAYPFASVKSIAAYGFAGNDIIKLASTVFTGAYIDGGDGNDALYGGVGNDTINAGAGTDYVETGAGDNRVAGGDGNDTLIGGIGRDRIFGGAGNDSIIGGAGGDIVSGDDGNDIVVGGASNDTVYGMAGNDTLNGLSGSDLIDGGDGVDTAKTDVLDTYVNVEVKV